MKPWYKVVVPRKEVREGRSFNPDEFAIALEQVVAGTAPADYRDPAQFFARTCFTRALRQHLGMVLRRLVGKTGNTAPVLTLVTQFGGGKTHTLTALYHLATSGPKALGYPGVADVVREAGLWSLPRVRVGVFVGSAWDPQEGRETPWIDLARQIAGTEGLGALGKQARKSPPGTDALSRVFRAAGAPVLLLFDEVLNFINRHRGFADQFHAFIQNLTVAMTGTTHGAAVISLPRSQVEMAEWDYEWQERITKVVRRVARDLIANDESEISEVVRRRLFEDLGSERTRRYVAQAFAKWCFDRRAQLPPEWTAVDTASTEVKAREFLRKCFEACYPFHPATLSVFQRKWQALPQYQQTRGTLAMFAQWIAIAYREGFTRARTEPLITLGSAPLGVDSFCNVVVGQIGEEKLRVAIQSDIAHAESRARALDADTRGPLRDIHRRVGTAILFESSGGQTDKVAHLPELRFALGEPEVDTTSVDNAAFALADRAYYIRRVGSDGFKIAQQPTVKKVVNDRRASLDEETEIKPAMRWFVEQEFSRGAQVPVVAFPRETADVPDSPRLTLVVVEPELAWPEDEDLRQRIAEWTTQRGETPRLYPGALVWCVRKPGADLREKVELSLAWNRVQQDLRDEILGAELDRREKQEVQSCVREARDAAREEVWASYRFAIIFDRREKDGLKVIDLGAGHSSSGTTLCGRVITALKSEGFLNESVGAGYIERHWPPALEESGAWPLSSLLQSFLDGSLTRLVDPEQVLRSKIVEFVARGDFGLASGRGPDGNYDRVWYCEPLSPDEVAFETDVFLLTRKRAQELKSAGGRCPKCGQEPCVCVKPETVCPKCGRDPCVCGEPPAVCPRCGQDPCVCLSPPPVRVTVRGKVPPELWNRLGTKLIPRLRSGTDLKIHVHLSVSTRRDAANRLMSGLRQAIEDLGLSETLEVSEEDEQASGPASSSVGS